MTVGGFTPMTIDEFNERIDEFLNDTHYGRLTENSVLITEIKEWR